MDMDALRSLLDLKDKKHLRWYRRALRRRERITEDSTKLHYFERTTGLLKIVCNKRSNRCLVSDSTSDESIYQGHIYQASVFEADGDHIIGYFAGLGAGGVEWCPMDFSESLIPEARFESIDSAIAYVHGKVHENLQKAGTPSIAYIHAIGDCSGQTDGTTSEVMDHNDVYLCVHFRWTNQHSTESASADSAIEDGKRYCIRNGQRVRIQDLKPGDVARMFESYGMPCDGGAAFRVVSSPYERDGVWSVDTVNLAADDGA